MTTIVFLNVFRAWRGMSDVQLGLFFLGLVLPSELHPIFFSCVLLEDASSLLGLKIDKPLQCSLGLTSFSRGKWKAHILLWLEEQKEKTITFKIQWQRFSVHIRKAQIEGADAKTRSHCSRLEMPLKTSFLISFEQDWRLPSPPEKNQFPVLTC